MNLITTELSAINTMLTAIGETPVNSLTEPVTADVAIAKSVLNEISVEVQSEAWHWNTEDEFELTINIDNEIPLPSNCLKIYFRSPQYIDYLQRGDRVYNRTDHTFKFEVGAKIYPTIVFLLPFEEMPETARRYITLKATRVFQERVVGSGNLRDFHSLDEAKARVALQAEDIRMDRPNILAGLTHYRSWQVANVFKGRR